MTLNRFLLALLLLSGAMASVADAQILPPEASSSAGFNPRQVVMGTVPSGRTLALVTSDGSNYVTQLYKGNPVGSPIDVGSRSWDVAFVGAGTAVVSLLDTDGIAVLRIDVATDQWVLDQVYPVPGANLMESTRLLPIEGTQRVLVANRGAPPAGAEPWQNAVYEIEVPTFAGAPTLLRTFVTESEPSAMAISPDGTRLFVATIRGAFGGDGIITNESFLATGIHDGGSIVMYDFATSTRAFERFEIGSPVRDLAIWTGEPAGGSAPDFYRLYFTNVGAGAASEDPDFGGRRIPNVISDIDFGLADNQARTRRDVVLSHCPEGEGGAGCLDIHVVPEDLLLVDNGDGKDLYVTFSGSGNVAIIDLEVDGSVPVISGSPSVDMTSSSFGGGNARILEATGWDSTTQIFPAREALSSDAGFLLYQADLNHVVTHSIGSEAGVSGSSNPRGLWWNATRNEVTVAARLSQTLEHIAVPTRSYPARPAWTVFAWGGAEPDAAVQARRFFAAGAAFDFRETTSGAMVDNLSCGTCHPNTRTDGKVRDTRTRQLLAKPGGGKTRRLPVAVPSVLDVALTEWLFFEGLHTIEDNGTVHGTDCAYCNSNQFFPDTHAFTTTLRSTTSPHAPTKELASPSQAGRWWFDAMNCSRCHNGDVSNFARSRVPLAPGLTQGPLTLNDPAARRMLHDSSQVFISGEVPGIVFDLNSDFSLRNMTVVGTRPGSMPVDDPLLPGNAPGPPGVNTPAIADAWRNGPYLHDGRYRSLEEVLDHTWLEGTEGYRAAPHWANQGPDNYSDSAAGRLVLGPPSIASLNVDFQSHQHDRPSTSWISVASYLGSRPSLTGNGSARDDLLAFLRSASAATELCEGNYEIDPEVSGMRVMPVGPGQYQILWDTNLPARCEIVVTGTTGTPLWSRSAVASSPGYEHSTPVITLPQGQRYTATVTVARPWGVCDPGTAVQESFGWKDMKIRFGLTAAARPLPDRSSIDGIHPNPFNPRTSIEFAVVQDADVDVSVFDIRGRRIATLIDEHMRAGWNNVVWEGTDSSGRQVASGVYFVKIRVGKDVDVKRMALVR